MVLKFGMSSSIKVFLFKFAFYTELDFLKLSFQMTSYFYYFTQNFLLLDVKLKMMYILLSVTKLANTKEVVIIDHTKEEGWLRLGKI